LKLEDGIRRINIKYNYILIQESGLKKKLDMQYGYSEGGLK